VHRGDAPALGKLVAERMQGAAELSVPLVVQVGQGGSWREAH
jgi:DNA polymerase I-like protein with 3'-5' exonuclease and polymerase domains